MGDKEEHSGGGRIYLLQPCSAHPLPVVGEQGSLLALWHFLQDSISASGTQPAVMSPQGQESPVQGPRIKHVCRHAAVALGQSRAMVPEDMPRLSALPLREREEIAASPAAEGKYRDGAHSGRCLHAGLSLWVTLPSPSVLALG